MKKFLNPEEFLEAISNNKRFWKIHPKTTWLDFDETHQWNLIVLNENKEEQLLQISYEGETWTVGCNQYKVSSKNKEIAIKGILQALEEEISKLKQKQELLKELKCDTNQKTSTTKTTKNPLIRN
jgi:hypothetical protein